MNFQAPSENEIKKILIDAPYFDWPTFAHMPLNCFDLTAALLSFPGDISEARQTDSDFYASYTIDINDLDTSIRFDKQFDVEMWNEKSLTVLWRLGLLRWSCFTDLDDFCVLNQGFFRVGINILRFQNIENVYNILEPRQLRIAIYESLQPHIEKGFIQPIQIESIFSKDINGVQWTIARSFNGLNYPEYEALKPIDERTAISVSATLGNCWFGGETIPEEVEQKHLASFWDFLSHICLHPTHDNDLQIGSTVREAPGQAEKVDDDLPEW